MMSDIKLAYLVAARVHAGQVRKDGSPYMGHCTRVSCRVEHLGTHAAVVALLHDVIEDTPLGFDGLKALFGPTVATDVLALTRLDHETYKQFVERIARDGSYTALRVKLADLADNLMPATGAESLRGRYIKSDAIIRRALLDRFGERV